MEPQERYTSLWLRPVRKRAKDNISASWEEQQKRERKERTRKACSRQEKTIVIFKMQSQPGIDNSGVSFCKYFFPLLKVRNASHSPSSGYFLLNHEKTTMLSLVVTVTTVASELLRLSCIYWDLHRNITDLPSHLCLLIHCLPCSLSHL